MRRIFCALLLAGLPLLPSAGDLHAEEKKTGEEPPVEESRISDEDREVIRMMELLQWMELLQNMELLEGKLEPAPEEKK